MTNDDSERTARDDETKHDNQVADDASSETPGANLPGSSDGGLEESRTDSSHRREFSHLGSLSNLITMLAGLTLTNAMLLLFTGGSYQKPIPLTELDGYSLLCFFLLMLNMIRFYHGNIRNIESGAFGFTSNSRDSTPDSRLRASPGLTFLLAFLQCGVLSAASFYIGQPLQFCYFIISLLGLQVMWYLFALQRVSGDAFPNQKLWLINNVLSLIVLYYSRVSCEGLGLGFSDDTYIAILACVFAVNSLSDLWISWRFYFPVVTSRTTT